MHTVKIGNAYHLTHTQNPGQTLCGMNVPRNAMLDEKHRHETSCLACAEKAKQAEKEKAK